MCGDCSATLMAKYFFSRVFRIFGVMWSVESGHLLLEAFVVDLQFRVN